jgi:hypothetical protein
MFFYFYIYTNPISSLCLPKRDYSKEWLPLLTVETEANGDSKSTSERGPPCWFVELVVPIQEIFVLPWLLESAQYKIFFS